MSAHPASGLRYLGLRVRVESADTRDLTWLQEFVAPPFEVVDAGGWNRAVSFEVETKQHAALMDLGTDHGVTAPCFALDQQLVHHPVWASRSGERIVYDQEFDVFYHVRAGALHVRVVTAEGNRAARIGLMRVVRELGMSYVWRSGGIVAHAAAVRLGDEGLAIVGPKGAGKTSLLTFLLRHRDAQYVSNDRVLLRIENGRPLLRGLPTLVSVRSGTLAMFPALRDQLATRSYDHSTGLREAAPDSSEIPRLATHGGRSLSPGQFCELLGVTRVTQTLLTGLLFPRVSGGRGGIELEPLSPGVAAVKLGNFLLRMGRSPETRSIFDFAVDEPIARDPPLQARCRALTSRVQCFECRLGQDAYRDLDCIDVLLERLHR
jgi:hypothetical protein